MQETSTNKVALITGAGRRIGRSIALDLARNGWHVAVHFNTSQEAALDTASQITRAGGTAITVCGDLRDVDAIGDIVANANSALGPVSCLVNNASLFEADRLDTLTPQSWNDHFDINLRAPVFLSQHMVAQLPPAASGNIVHIIDQRVLRQTPEFFSYTAAKSALWAATRTMAQALAPRVRVNAIGPGPTLPSSRQTQDDFEQQSLSLPLARSTAPDEICDAIRFILASPSMTGQMLALDGGQHLAWQTPDAMAKE